MSEFWAIVITTVSGAAGMLAGAGIALLTAFALPEAPAALPIALGLGGMVLGVCSWPKLVPCRSGARSPRHRSHHRRAVRSLCRRQANGGGDCQPLTLLPGRGECLVVEPLRERCAELLDVDALVG